MQIVKQELSTAHCNQTFVMSNVNMNVLLSHNELYIFSLFWPQKVYLPCKIDSFLTFRLINFIVQTLKCAETLILYLFCP